MKNNSTADYIELSINNNDENDDPPDLEEQNELFEKENYKPTTALLEEDSNSIIYESNELKHPPKHESSLAIQVYFLREIQFMVA